MATKKITKISKFDFESSLQELEKIVNTMEQGGLGLEESLNLFTQGVSLTKQCQQAIKAAEQKVRILTAEDKVVDFQLTPGSSNEDVDVDE